VVSEEFTDVSDEHTAYIFKIKEQAVFAACFSLVNYLDYALTLKMEAVFFTETLMHYRTTFKKI
jgi:hypothetical protein